MKKTFFMLLAVMLPLIFSACNDDVLPGAGNYSEGEPATLSISLSVPGPKDVKPMGRSLDADYESRINQLMIVGFEVNSGRKMVTDLTGKLTAGPYNSGAGRTYTINGEVSVTTGRYRLYLIANWQSDYAGLSDDLIARIQDQSTYNEDEISQLVFSNQDNVFTLPSTGGMPMTQYLVGESDSYYEIVAGQNVLTADLKRATANITFNIKNGNATEGGLKPQFTPTSYAIYRLPKQAACFPTGPGAVEIGSDRFSTAGQPASGTTPDEGYEYAFNFYMLENNPGVAPGNATSFADREEWDWESNNQGSGEFHDYGDRKFTNAPEGATFVVITGTYYGPAGKDADGDGTDDIYTGTVSYIVHLGNFAASWNDYSVNRNEHHKYNITVNSAHSIIANVEVDDGHSNPSAEGFLMRNQNSATVDCHYAKVMLKIPKTTIFKENGDGTNRIVLRSVRTGYRETAYLVDDLKDEDYKWIQFQMPKSTTEFPQYAGINSDGTSRTDNGSTWVWLPDLVKELQQYNASNGTSQLTHALADGDYFYVAAFVDENVYLGDENADLSLAEWAGYGIPDRMIALNVTNVNTSGDGQSAVADDAAFTIAQNSIVTPYTLQPSIAGLTDATYNPFGLEREPGNTTAIEEAGTGTGHFYSTNEHNRHSYVYNGNESLIGSSYTENTGQANTCGLFDITATTGVNDIYDAFYSYDDQTKNYVFRPASYYTVSQAIAMHNRDLDGNGVITNDEVKWYIPTSAQYFIIDFGSNQLPDFAHLTYEDITSLDDITMNQGTASADNSMPRYLTSSPDVNSRLFWQDQAGAQSQIALSGWYTSYINRITFVRSFGKFSDSYKADITRMSTHDATNRIVKIISPRISRSFVWTEEYPYHTVKDATNTLPTAFEYSNSLTTLSSFNYGNIMTSNPENNLSYLYSQVTLSDGWRVPNQKELALLYLLGVLTDKAGTSNTVLSCTTMGSDFYPNRNYFLSFIGGRYALPQENNFYNTATTILVRDVDPVTGDPLTE